MTLTPGGVAAVLLAVVVVASSVPAGAVVPPSAPPTGAGASPAGGPPAAGPPSPVPSSAGSVVTPRDAATAPAFAADAHGWETLDADGDEAGTPLDVATVAARHDADTFFLRYTYHGDYDPFALSQTWAYLDVDGDTATGQPVQRGGIGADYAVLVTPGAYTLYQWHPTFGYTAKNAVPEHFRPDFAADSHEVGVALADVDDPAAVSLVVEHLYYDGTAAQPRYDYAPDSGSVTYHVRGTDPGPDPDPDPTPGPDGWTTLATDGDEAGTPLDVATVAARHDADTFFLRYTYHGDYHPQVLSQTWAYLDVDGDAATGQPIQRAGLGADYAVLVTPTAYALYEWHPTLGYTVKNPVAAHFLPEFSAESHEVGVALADVDDPTTVRLAVEHLYYDGTAAQPRYDHAPDSGSVTYAVGETSPGADPDQETIATDPNEPAIPVDVASVSISHDAATVYLRYTYHGDYAVDAPVQTDAFLDVDADPGTGQFVESRGAGFDYLVASGPNSFGVFRWNEDRGRFEDTGTASARFLPDFGGESHEVGVPLSALSGRGDTLVVAVQHRHGTDDPAVDGVPDSGTLTHRLGPSTDPDPRPTPDDPFDGPIPGTSLGLPPNDLDGDGLYEDVDGDGDADFDDAVELAFVDPGSLTAAQVAALDFEGDSDLDFGDAVDLAFRV